MIQPKQLLFIISLLFVLPVVNAQQEQDQDTIKRIEVYGIRLGIDLYKPIISIIDDDYKGFEIATDVRVYKDFYAALEFGFDDKYSTEDYINFSTKGSYFKLGANYNAYDNWAGMTNEIFVGFRYGVSFFDQTINSYSPNMYGEYFIADPKNPNFTYSDRTVQWAEFVMGIKAETFKNLYLGFSLGFKILTSNKDPENFKNMFAPGFNKISINNMGFGFNYTISYLIPYMKKNK